VARERGGIIATLVSLLFLALLLLGIYLARHPLLRFAAGQLIVEDALEKSDAIIVLSDDNFYADRATRAAELFRQNLAPVVVASGIRLRPYAGISELMTHDLIERGVPKEKIIPFPQDADNTKRKPKLCENAAGKKLENGNCGHVELSYPPRQIYRQQDFWPQHYRSHGQRRDGDFDPANWYDHRKAVKRFVHEVAGYLLAVWNSMERLVKRRVLPCLGAGASRTTAVGYCFTGHPDLLHAIPLYIG